VDKGLTIPPAPLSASADYLMPPNERPAALLPPLDRAASDTPNSGGSVRAVYAGGIEFIDQMATIGGMFAGAVWTGILVIAFFAVWLVQVSSFDAFTIIFFGVWAAVFLALGRADSVGWRYQPVLFDKVAQKVHVFTDLGSPWWEVWRLLGGTRFRIDSFDWACARGEVAEVVVMGGANLPRKEYALTLAITDAPGSRDVIARFGVGFTAGYDDGQTQVARWEHIRRYMRGEGPTLTPGDELYPDDSKEHWTGAFTSGQPLLGPGSKVWWTGEGLHGAWFLTIPFGLAFLVILPLTLPYSLIRWAVRRFKGTPRWPTEILASVGPLVDPESLQPRPNARYTGDYSHPPKLTFKQRRAEAKRRKQGTA
jgi:hypothetical protein